MLSWSLIFFYLIKSSRKIGVSFERSEQGGLAECQPCGGATQEPLLVLCLDSAHPHSRLWVTAKNNLGLLLHQMYTTVCIVFRFSGFQAITTACFDAGLRMKAPVRLAQVIKCSAALLGCFIFPALICLSRPWALFYSRDSLMYSAVNQSVSALCKHAYSPLLADSIV